MAYDTSRENDLMIAIQYLYGVLGVLGGLGILSIVPLWIMTHTFMIHRLDKAILGKSLKGTFDDNLWMINSRAGSYAGLVVLHNRPLYRKFLSLGNKSQQRLKKVRFFPKSLSSNFLDYEENLENLTLGQRLFLYWLFWSLFLMLGCGGMILFLNKVCGIPIPS